jgi:trimethylamine:corrinoid methyltransferase-like protein
MESGVKIIIRGTNEATEALAEAAGKLANTKPLILSERMIELIRQLEELGVEVEVRSTAKKGGYRPADPRIKSPL